jgi:leucyl aminopeptidase (aminopeptidase T)
MEGAKKFVIDFCRIKSGERVVILADDVADAFVTESVAQLAREAGAEVTLIWIKFSEIAYKGTPDAVYEAAKKAEKFLRLSLNTGHHTLGLNIAMAEYGCSCYTLLPATPDLLTSKAAKFPLELINLIGLKAFTRVRKAKTLKITTPKGTDLFTELNPKAWDGYPGKWLLEWGGEKFYPDYIGIVPGDTPNTFPPGACGTYPKPDTARGVIVYDSMANIGVAKEPLVVTIENGWATKIEGGQEAEKLKSMLDPVKNSKHFSEIMFGLNPKSRINLSQKPTPLEAERHAGNTHMALGRGIGAKYPSNVHFDGFVLKPTIYLDGEPIIKEGWLTFLGDREVRECAKKYGEPDEILKDEWEVV